MANGKEGEAIYEGSISMLQYDLGQLFQIFSSFLTLNASIHIKTQLLNPSKTHNSKLKTTHPQPLIKTLKFHKNQTIHMKHTKFTNTFKDR